MNKKRVFAFLVLGILFFTLAVQFASLVSADPVTDWISGVINKYNSGEGVSDGFSRVLFGIIIAILVYSVLDSVPGLNGGQEGMSIARGVVAVIIGYFGTAYLVKGELLTLLSTYSALGFTLAFILPFLILVFFSYDIVNSDKIKNDFISLTLVRGVWLVYLAFLAYRLLLSSPLDAYPVVTILLWVLIFVALAVLIFSKKLYALVRLGRMRNIRRRAAEVTQTSAARDVANAQAAETESNSRSGSRPTFE